MNMNSTPHIEITPDTCSGRPRVRGTRIRVANIVRWTEQGQSPEEIVAEYPQLSLADVHAALAFYFDNKEAIDKQIAEDAAFVTAVKNDQNPVAAEIRFHLDESVPHACLDLSINVLPEVQCVYPPSQPASRRLISALPSAPDSRLHRRGSRCRAAGLAQRRVGRFGRTTP